MRSVEISPKPAGFKLVIREVLGFWPGFREPEDNEAAAKLWSNLDFAVFEHYSHNDHLVAKLRFT